MSVEAVVEQRGGSGMAGAVVVIQTSGWVGPPLYPVPRLSLRGEGWGFPLATFFGK